METRGGIVRRRDGRNGSARKFTTISESGPGLSIYTKHTRTTPSSCSGVIGAESRRRDFVSGHVQHQNRQHGSNRKALRCPNGRSTAKIAIVGHPRSPTE